MTSLHEYAVTPAQASTEYLPTAPLDHVRCRATILRRVRAFFDDRGFLEVQTPLLSRDTVVDRYVEPLRVLMFDDPQQIDQGPTWFLQTSPELHMKRLLAAGATAIYQIAPAFRAGESGPLHNVEFTLLEWYRVGDTMQAGIGLLQELAHAMIGVADSSRLSYRNAFQQFLGLDPFTAPLEALQQAAAAPAPAGVFSNDRDELLDWLMAERIAPQLGFPQPTVIYDFPPTQAALAQVRDDSVPVAERFELYWQGIELANGYHELRCPDELASRFRRLNQLRVEAGRRALPETSRLLDAMRHGLPECCGVALGIDRLIMLLLSESTLERVMNFPARIA